MFIASSTYVREKSPQNRLSMRHYSGAAVNKDIMVSITIMDECTTADDRFPMEHGIPLIQKHKEFPKRETFCFFIDVFRKQSLKFSHQPSFIIISFFCRLLRINIVMHPSFRVLYSHDKRFMPQLILLLICECGQGFPVRALSRAS